MIEHSSPSPAAAPIDPETQRVRQGARAVFLVRPCSFGFNRETAQSNVFQKPSGSCRDPALRAQKEFDKLVNELREAGIRVLVAGDTPDPPKPDAVFPNNWLSTHEDGSLVLYPMQAENRRRERRLGIGAEIGSEFLIRRVVDLTHHEREGRYLEGTGSLVLDRPGRRAYAARSIRTDPELARIWGEAMGYRVEIFETGDASEIPVYHTNVLMAIGTRWAVIGTGLIRDPSDRRRIPTLLRDTGHEVLELTPGQVADFAGNILELEGAQGPVIVISRRGFHSLSRTGCRFIENHGRIVQADLDVIETVGGGGVRCMLAEIFLPARVHPTPVAAPLP
ncbi:Amidinotransferase family protein [mine drainage metagenome]|uniref:Amidinotransferase family protein n=1 Tax=mine drainage metagenome TaxID=410659 RepID=T1BTQ9_9ZZZZ